MSDGQKLSVLYTDVLEITLLFQSLFVDKVEVSILFDFQFLFFAMFENCCISIIRHVSQPTLL